MREIWKRVCSKTQVFLICGELTKAQVCESLRPSESQKNMVYIFFFSFSNILNNDFYISIQAYKLFSKRESTSIVLPELYLDKL